MFIALVNNFASNALRFIVSAWSERKPEPVRLLSFSYYFVCWFQIFQSDRCDIYYCHGSGRVCESPEELVELVVVIQKVILKPLKAIRMIQKQATLKMEAERCWIAVLFVRTKWVWCDKLKRRRHAFSSTT